MYISSLGKPREYLHHFNSLDKANKKNSHNIDILSGQNAILYKRVKEAVDNNFKNVQSLQIFASKNLGGLNMFKLN